MNPLARLAPVLVLLLAPASASADEPIAACVMGLLLDQQTEVLGLARVVSGRARFQWSPKVCAASDRECLSRQYVVKGDVVVIGPRHGAFTCAFYPNGSGGGTGWVRSEHLQSLASAPTGGGWAGRWVRDDWADVRLTAVGPDLVVKGDAIWRGANPDNIHTGEIEGRGRPAGDSLAAGDEICSARFRRLGPYLLVADNGGCGGANVSFTGVYRRAR